MKYAVTLNDFCLLTPEGEMIEIAQGTYLKRENTNGGVDEYVSTDRKLTIKGYVVRKQKSYFYEVSETEYKQNSVNILDAVKAIDKIIKDCSVSKEMVINLLKIHYKIIDNIDYRYPGSINIPVIPYVQPVSCTICGRVESGACFNVACPNKYNITFTK